MSIKCYQNNPRLKDAGQSIPYTANMVSELQRCSKDPVYFIKKYVKIITVDHGVIPFELYPYEEKYVRTMHNNRFVICKFPRQTGKALALETKIPTPTGWTTMGDLKVGDVIYGNDGRETKVSMATDVMYEHDCYEITFDNGEKVVADAEHLWEISCSDWGHKPKVCETKDVASIFKKKQENGQALYISATKPIVGENKELPIQPYTFGMWLGDGETKGSRITSHKLDYDDIVEKIENEGYSTTKNVTKNQNIILYNIVGLRTALKSIGVFGNKHIPDIYKRASIEQRLDLIRGLMDSDGYCSEDGSCEFYQKKFQLVQDFREVLSSLGIKSRIRETVIGTETYYTVSFSTRLSVFNLSRKKVRQEKLVNHPKNERIYFKEIRPVKSVPVRCIQVDNDNHMFLFGETMVPTHNSTTTIAYFLWYILFNDNVKVAILANKGETAQELMSRLQFAYEFLPFWIQQGVQVWNKRSIELENGSKIRAAATSSSGVRGDTFNIIFLDEFAHIDPPSLAEEFFTSVYPTIASGKTTKVFIVSTPKGMNLFYKMWMDAHEGRSEYVPLEINWWDVPGRDEKWKQQTIRNTSPEQFAQEFECVSGETLVQLNTGEIPLKDLYGKLSHLPNNSEMRLPESAKINLSNLKIQTHNGFEDFLGVNKIVKDRYLTLHFSNGSSLICSENHRITTIDGEVVAKDLTENEEVLTDTSIGCFLVSKELSVKPIELYDVVNSGKDRLYYSNGILSHNCEFLGSTGTLINPTKLRQLVYKEPIKSMHGLDVFVAPMKDHQYALAVDTAQGKGKDYHAIQVVDVTQIPYVQVAKYRNNSTPVMLLPNIIEQIAKMYNNAVVLIEIMDTGMQVADMLHFDLEYENIIHVTVKGRFGQMVGGGFAKTFQRGLKMSPQVRRQGCMNLKTLIEQDKLIINDFETIKELTTFVSDGKNGKFEAEEGCNDDLVMAFVVFSWLVAQKYFRENNENLDIRSRLEEENRRWIEDEMIIPVVIDDGLGDDYEKDKNGNVWTTVV